MSRVMMFTSLKGGVGKTTATAALGFALSFFGKRVLCVDLDFGVRGLDLALGAENHLGADVLEVVTSRSDPAAEAAKLAENFFFLPAPALFNTRQADAVSQEELDAFLARCKEAFDYTLLDLPAGGGDLFLPLARSRELTDAVVVSTAEATALRAAEQTGFEVRSVSSATVSLILNRCPVRAKDLEHGLFRMAQDAAISVLGVVPEDGLVRESAAAGVALTRLPQTAASRAYWNIATRIAGWPVGLLDGVFSKRRKKQFCK